MGNRHLKGKEGLWAGLGARDRGRESEIVWLGERSVGVRGGGEGRGKAVVSSAGNP